MTQTIAHIRTVQNSCVAVGWARHRTLTIDRETRAGGMGLGFNGGELLLLAIGGCYCNDLFREAARRGMEIKAEIPTSLRLGTPVTLRDPQAIPISEEKLADKLRDNHF